MTLEQKAEIAFKEMRKFYAEKDAHELRGAVHVGSLGAEDFFGMDSELELVINFGAIAVSENGKHRFLSSFDFWDAERKKSFTKHEQVFRFDSDRQ